MAPPPPIRRTGRHRENLVHKQSLERDLELAFWGVQSSVHTEMNYSIFSLARFLNVIVRGGLAFDCHSKVRTESQDSRGQ